MQTPLSGSDTAVRYIEMETFIGCLTVTSDGDAITGVYMDTHRPTPGDRRAWVREPADECAVLATARAQLSAYFQGQTVVVRPAAASERY